jgi:hypothetical protein
MTDRDLGAALGLGSLVLGAGAGVWIAYQHGFWWCLGAGFLGLILGPIVGVLLLVWLPELPRAISDAVSYVRERMHRRRRVADSIALHTTLTDLLRQAASLPSDLLPSEQIPEGARPKIRDSDSASASRRSSNPTRVCSRRA